MFKKYCCYIVVHKILFGLSASLMKILYLKVDNLPKFKMIFPKQSLYNFIVFIFFAFCSFLLSSDVKKNL